MLNCLCVSVCVSLARGTGFVSAVSSNNSIREKGSVAEQCSNKGIFGSRITPSAWFPDQSAWQLSYLYSHASIDVTFLDIKLCRSSLVQPCLG